MSSPCPKWTRYEGDQDCYNVNTSLTTMTESTLGRTDIFIAVTIPYWVEKSTLVRTIPAFPPVVLHYSYVPRSQSFGPHFQGGHLSMPPESKILFRRYDSNALQQTLTYSLTLIDHSTMTKFRLLYIRADLTKTPICYFGPSTWVGHGCLNLEHTNCALIVKEVPCS